jgi:hypothetical protein
MQGAAKFFPIADPAFIFIAACICLTMNAAGYCTERSCAL